VRGKNDRKTRGGYEEGGVGGGKVGGKKAEKRELGEVKRKGEGFARAESFFGV